MNEDQMIELETKLAFQEQTLSELNDVIIDQQKQIDQVKARCDSLSMQLAQSKSDSPLPSPEDERPPHY